MLFLKIIILGMLFLGFAVFQDVKSFCLGMKSGNKMKTQMIPVTVRFKILENMKT